MGDQIRRLDESDLDVLREFFAGLSPQSRYLRFLSTNSALPPDLAHSLVWESPQRRNLGAFLGSEMIGHVTGVRSDSGVLDLGVVVADRHRRQGVATRLVQRLIEGGRAPTELRLDVLSSNRLILDWVGRHLPGAAFARDADTVTARATFRPCTTGNDLGLVVPVARAPCS